MSRAFVLFAFVLSACAYGTLDEAPEASYSLPCPADASVEVARVPDVVTAASEPGYSGGLQGNGTGRQER